MGRFVSLTVASLRRTLEEVKNFELASGSCIFSQLPEEAGFFSLPLFLHRLPVSPPLFLTFSSILCSSLCLSFFLYPSLSVSLYLSFSLSICISFFLP